ncbi:uncharacterized protein [Diabrotica undecimpunctata]
MEKAILFTSVSLILFSLFSLGSSVIHCYQCNSGTDPECADLKVNSTNSKHYLPCDKDYHGNEPFCRIYVSNIVNVKDPKDAARIYRSCGWENSKGITKDSCRHDDSDFVKKELCMCFKDGCNSGRQIHSSYILTVLLIVLVYFRYYFI